MNGVPDHPPRTSEASSTPDPADFLAAYGDDTERALGELMGTVQSELRRIAHRARLGRRDRPSIGTSDLVNEVYLRLVGGAPHITDRNHFFAVAATTMRWILVSRERRRRRNEPMPTGLRDPRDDALEVDLLDLDDALERLAGHDRQLATIVEQMYFLDFTIDQIAVATGLSTATVSRRLKLARHWLYRQLGATE